MLFGRARGAAGRRCQRPQHWRRTRRTVRGCQPVGSYFRSGRERAGSRPGVDPSKHIPHRRLLQQVPCFHLGDQLSATPKPARVTGDPREIAQIPPPQTTTIGPKCTQDTLCITDYAEPASITSLSEGGVPKPATRGPCRAREHHDPMPKSHPLRRLPSGQGGPKTPSLSHTTQSQPQLPPVSEGVPLQSAISRPPSCG